MDQPAPETSPKKTSRSRKISAPAAAVVPVIEPAPLEARSETVEIEPAEPIASPESAEPHAVEPQIQVKAPTGMNYQRLAMVALVGTFIVILTCICSWTMIAMTFFLTAPWG